MSLKSLLAAQVVVVLKAVPVPAEEWGIDLIHIAELSGDERATFEENWQAYRDKFGDDADFRSFSVIALSCDAARNFEFKPEEYADAIRSLGKRNSKVTARAFSVACSLNGLTKSDLDAVEKKFVSPATSVGSSESLSTSDTRADVPGYDPSPAPTTPKSQRSRSSNRSDSTE